MGGILTVSRLMEHLRKFPGDSQVLAYEGECCGITVWSPEGKELAIILTEPYGNILGDGPKEAGEVVFAENSHGS